MAILDGAVTVAAASNNVAAHTMSVQDGRFGRRFQLYRGARAALVTPLRDGMNLVAKEYVAAQDAENPGVLVLSRFAGAAHELGAALLVNPYDPEGVAMAINRALSMPLTERRQRQEQNYRVLVQNDITHWAERFLAMLEPAAEAADPAPARVAGSRR